MRNFLLILILTLSFQSLTKADDISDFEIEGMSIGDSALDFFSKEEIKKNKYYAYSSKEYYQTFLDGPAIRIMCVDQSKYIEDEKGWVDNLRVIMNSKEFNNFIQNN